MLSPIRKIFYSVPARDSRIVLENFISLSSLQAINYLLPALLFPYLFRVLGPAKFGLIFFAQSFVQYFVILTDYGFNLSASREIALCRDRKSKMCEIFSSVMTVKLLLALAAFVIMCATVRFVPRFRADWQVYVFSFGAVLGNTLFPVWFFQGTEKMKYTAVLQIFAGILMTICLFIFVRSPSDYLLVPLIYSAVWLVSGISGLYLAFSKFEMNFVLQTYPDIKEQLRAGWAVFSSTVAVNTYTATRIFAVGLLTNNTLTGYFAIAEKIAAMIQAFPMASFSQAVYPRLSRIYLKNKNRALKLMYKAQDLTSLGFTISVPIIFALAPFLIRIVCGAAYPEAILTLRLLLAAVLFVGANAFKIQFLLVSGRADTYARIHVTMALAGLLALFVLIGLVSYPGAAVAAVLIEAGVFLWTDHAMRDVHHRANLLGP